MIETKSEAQKIKEWRQKGLTYRRIAEEAAAYWPHKKIIPGNQAYGITLIDEACLILYEREEDWNEDWL